VRVPIPIRLADPRQVHEQDERSALERLRYLCPSRYFRFYLLYDRVAHQTCWLPEGYQV